MHGMHESFMKGWFQQAHVSRRFKGMPWTNRPQVSCLVLDEADRMLDMGRCLKSSVAMGPMYSHVLPTSPPAGFVFTFLCVMVSPPKSEGFEIVWISFLCKKCDIMNESIHSRLDDQSSQTQIMGHGTDLVHSCHDSCPQVLSSRSTESFGIFGGPSPSCPSCARTIASARIPHNLHTMFFEAKAKSWCWHQRGKGSVKYGKLIERSHERVSRYHDSCG